MSRLLSITVIGILLSGLLLGCEEELPDSPWDISYISYGTSFGECLGYCVKSTMLTDSIISFLKSGWNMEGRLPDIYFSRIQNIEDWESLLEEVDFNEFTQLDSIIGCPDCADGGAEWIEIKENGTIYKVIFEYGNEPEAVKPYIEMLRTYLDSFDYGM